ncbi:T9SS type A sorting domain-containing protein [bacterium]|nr:T9SS type A sorting domain-containing protein [bacterium]
MRTTRTEPLRKFSIYVISIFCFLSFNLNSAQAQTIIVDQSGAGDFTTIEAAVNSLNGTTISQTVRIRVKAGFYDGHIQFDSINGTSAQNQIILESFSGDTADVVIKHDTTSSFPARHGLEIRKVSNLVFRNLSFKCPKDDGFIIALDEGAKDILIEGNHFMYDNSSNRDPVIGMFFNFRADDTDLGSLILRNNRCDDLHLYSRLGTTFRHSSFEMTNNTIYIVRNLSSTTSPIYDEGDILIENNIFFNAALGALYVRGKAKINRNLVITDNTAISVGFGVYSDSNIVISNNMVLVDQATAIYVGTSKVKVWNNNIAFTPNSRFVNGIYMVEMDSVDIVNNIIATEGDDCVGIFFPDTVFSSTLRCDYNNYYMPNSYISRVALGTDIYRTTVAEHQERYKIDSNSYMFDPLFETDSNLHIRNAALLGKGLHIPQILYDFDGDERDPDNPVIGADMLSGEIDLQPSQFLSFTGNFYPGKTMEIEYEVENIGSLNLTSLEWEDELYLSSDQTLDSTDVLLNTASNLFDVNGGNSYSRKLSAAIPYTSGGTYYFIVKINSTEISFEELSNNILVSFGRVLPTPQLPNLEVTSVSVPSSLFSGKSFGLEWTVKNTGNAATTGSWSDYIYMATDSNLLKNPEIMGSDSLFKRKVGAPSGLQPGQSYTSSSTFSIPIKFSGNVYYHVQTNGDRNIFEQDTGFYDNGRMSDPLNIIQSPLPDLTVVDANIPATAFSGDTIAVNWTVKNVGQQKTYRTDRYYRATPLQDNPTMWYDRIVITKKPFYDPDDDDNVVKAFYVRPNNDELGVDSTYTVYDSINFTRCEYGKYYVFAVTNYTESTFELRYDNNAVFIDSIELILEPNPDLVPQHLTINNSPASGKDVELSYTIVNDGFSDLEEYIKDRFYLHLASNINFGGARYLGQNYSYETIDQGDSVRIDVEFQIPYDIHGNWYLSLITDANDQICEAPGEDNNILTRGPLSIALSPQPDIEIDAEGWSDTMIAGQNFPLIIETKNTGDGDVEESSFYNRVILWGSSYNILRVYSIPVGLEASSSKFDTFSLSLPLDLEEGLYRLEIQADNFTDVYEYNGEFNNSFYSEQFYVERNNNLVPDFNLLDLEVLSSDVRAGDVIELDVSVRNDGRGTQYTGWKDALVLRDDDGNVLDTYEPEHLGRVASGEEYTDNVKYQLPYEYNGNLSLEFIVNNRNIPTEYIRGNNSEELILDVEAYIPPDLEPVSISSLKCCAVYALQLDTVSIEVENNGPGAMDDREYQVKLYLSDDEVLDKYDKTIGTLLYSGTISVGNSATIEIPVKYPSSVSGDLYYIAVVDSEDGIYEADKEDNNKYASLYTISLSNEITDLVLDSIEIRTLDSKNDPFFFVDYEFSKPILDSLDRSWTDKVVLAKQRSLFPEATIVQTQAYENELESGVSEYTGSILVTMPRTIQPGWYYIGMVMDERNEIYESSEVNNVRFTRDSFYFDYSVPLTLDVLKDTFFFEGQFATPVYYNVERGSDLGMIVDLDVSDDNSSTELYHAAGKIPSNLRYDNKYSDPYLADQQILVPVTDTAVTDYLFLKPSYVPPVYNPLDPDNNQIDPVPYDIIARSATFSVYSVYPENGSSNGNTAVSIKGFDFKSETQFALIQNTDTISAYSTVLINSSQAVCYFDLRDTKLGDYNVVAYEDTRTTSLNNGFEIIADEYEDPWMNFDVTPVELTRRNTVMNVNFGNYSNTNGYDYWLIVAIAPGNGDLSHLSTSFVGSSEEELNEQYGFTGNPTGDSTHIDIDGVRYFAYWIPHLAAKSQTTFTYIINQSEEDTTYFAGLLFRQPMSAYTISGRDEDIAYSATMYELYEAYSNSVGAVFKSDFDCDNINIFEVQRELQVQTLLLADHVSGGVGTFSGATGVKDLSRKAYEAWKKDALLPFQAGKRGEEVKQKMFKEMVLEKKGFTDMAKGWWDNLDIVKNTTERVYKEDPPFSDLTKNVFSCLDNDPDLLKEVERCIFCARHNRPGGGTYHTCSNICKKKPKNQGNRFTRWVKSLDPNEIVGPDGVTELRYVEQGADMPYTIYFENKSTASAPAVAVSINNPLDTAFRLQSFELLEIGFGDTAFYFDGENNINTIIELGPDYNFQKLHVVAGIDPINQRAIWRMTTIDPNTGNPVIDPFGGFLPPNDSLGSGEGYVKYRIRLKDDVETGTVVSNEADIIFDQNEIIPTNVWTNRVIGSDPFSEVLPLPEFSGKEFEVIWTGSDGKDGPGIAYYSVYVSINEGPYQEWLAYSTDTSAIFIGENGSKYSFYSVIHLMNGDVEESPASFDAETTVKTGSIIEFAEQNILVYPNPGSTNLNIRQENSGTLQIEILTMDGRAVITQDLEGRINTIDVSALSKGLYIVRLYDGEQIKIYRWLKE